MLLVAGGFEYDGRAEIGAVEEEEVAAAVAEVVRRGISSVVGPCPKTGFFPSCSTAFAVGPSLVGCACPRGAGKLMPQQALRYQPAFTALYLQQGPLSPP